MSIKEKPRVLEFSFVSDKDPSLRYEVEYNSQAIVPIEIGYNGKKITMPIEFFTEVVDFLKGKGVIKGDYKNIDIGSKVNKSVFIPIPIIDGEETDVEKNEIPTSPITSFDTTISALGIAEKKLKEKESNESNIEEKEENFPKRKVIKTRVKDNNDPLQAEREAAELRGEVKRKIKRADR